LYLKNGVWVKGPPPKSSSINGPKITTHQAQRTAVVSSPRRLDALLRGRARICITRCLTSNTNILMADGSLKAISMIEPGDFVIGKDGKPVEVLTKTYSGKASELVSFRSNRMLYPITCTPEHQVLVLDLRSFEGKRWYGISYYTHHDYAKNLVKWLPASELTNKTFLLTPTDIDFQLADPVPIDLSDYLPLGARSSVTDDQIISIGRNHGDTLHQIAEELGVSYYQVADVSSGKSKKTKEIHKRIEARLKDRSFYTYTNRMIPINYDLGKFFGVILGDGSKRIRYKGGSISSGEVTVATNGQYPEQACEVQRLVKDLFGLDCSVCPSKKSKGVQVTFYSVPVALLLDGFGKKNTKHLPSQFFYKDEEFLRGLLDGLLETDGSVSGRAETFCNTSPHLASLVFWLWDHLGKNPKISMDGIRCSTMRDGRKVIGRYNTFYVWPLIHKDQKSQQRITVGETTYNISALRQIHHLSDEGQDVWDIGVKSGESFIAENVVVHNSLGGLGDIIMATPIARGIKRKHPESHVTYAVPTDYAGGDLLDLLLYNPYIDEIIDYKIVSRDDYDAFTDITRAGLAEEVRAAKNRVVPKNRIDLFSEESGFPLYGMTLPIYVMLEEERAWGKDFVAKQVAGKKPRGLIAVHLRSNDPKRTWPKDRVREFLTLCAKHNYHTFLFGWGDNADEWRISGTTLVFNYKIRQAAAILDACDLLVCPDSSMLHLGGALNKRIVSLFGSMPPACRINHYPNAIAVVNQKLSCLGCLYEPCHQNFYCMSSLLPEAVLSAVEMQLRQTIKQPGPGESVTVNTSSFEQDVLGTEIKSFEI